MKVELQLDEKNEETKVIITAKEMTEEVQDVLNKLTNKKEILKVIKNEETYLLKEEDIETVYSEEGKVFIKTEKDVFQTRKRLYELETVLSCEKFIRISNSEIVNFDKVSKLNTKMLGTICINFKSGYKTYVSRRYIKKIKEFLEI